MTPLQIAGRALEAQPILQAQSTAKPGAIWSWWWLWLALVVISITFVGIVAMIGRRRRLAGIMAPRPHRRRAIKDAWAEAGKRAEPMELDEEPGDPDDLENRNEGGS